MPCLYAVRGKLFSDAGRGPAFSGMPLQSVKEGGTSALSTGIFS